MGFYIRKSFGFGPLRLNLSRSGLGASIGVKGARLGVGPRGTYIHAGRGGLYYRKTLGAGSSGQGASSAVPPAPDSSTPTLPAAPAPREIESADVTKLTDSSSVDLLQDLNRVLARTQSVTYATWAVAALVVGLIVSSAPAGAWMAAAVLGTVALLCARHHDVTQGTAVLHYDLEPDAAAAFDTLLGGFREIQACQGLWHVSAAADARDPRRQAGAQELVSRTTVSATLSQPPRVVSNLAVPTLPAGRQTLYFFPDRLLVYERGRVGSVSYADLQVGVGQGPFIESGTVPPDAQVVGRTWRYVTKKGEPDRRFKDSPEFPVLLYGVFQLTSPTGLNERFQCSRAQAVSEFAAALEKLN